MKLLKEKELVWSPVVANNRMNRERNLEGINSYENDISFNVLKNLCSINTKDKKVRWIDLCCGTGKAVFQAVEKINAMNLDETIEIEGLDLVDMFEVPLNKYSNLKYLTSSLNDWQPEIKYDLITCVHGLHYIGDKLDTIEKAIKSLTDNGLFIANLDPENFRDQKNNSLKNMIVKKLKMFGIKMDLRKHILRCDGNKNVKFNLNYLGADDLAGPNYTGQEVVNSYYNIDD